MQDTVLSRSTPYQAITEQIIEAIEAGAGAFKMPWHTGGSPTSMPINAATDAPYRGINVLSLWIGSLRRGFPSGSWASYRQWQRLGAQVRAGERGTTIIFYKDLPPREPPDADDDNRLRYVIRSSRVFNAAQVDGWTPAELPTEASFKPNEQAEAFVQATGARVRHGFHTACYRRDLDDIEMPSPAWFMGSATSPPLSSYYATLLHELTHWTGARHALAGSSASGSGITPMRWRSWWRSSAQRSSVPHSGSRTRPGQITPPISRPGSKCSAKTPARCFSRRARRR